MSTGSDRHQPVMVEELLDVLGLKQSNTVIDATIGFGGHARAVLEELGPDGRLIGFERDPNIYDLISDQFSDDSRVTIHNDSYRTMDRVLNSHVDTVDSIYFDLGLSSFHLDESDRGFSFDREDDRFDCRFDPSEAAPAAADVLNNATPSQLTDILKKYGEVRRLDSIREVLLESRPVETVAEVREALEKVIPSHKLHGEMARVFQAFRINVNNEIQHLKEGLEAALDSLKADGRMAVISYHSIEDRTVKQFFRYSAKECICPPDLPVCACDKTKRCEAASESPLTPSNEEVEENPRARSATLRAVRKH